MPGTIGAKMKTAKHPILWMVLTALSLAGCSFMGSSSRDPGSIEPVYRVRNAPIPVPVPMEKPKAPYRKITANPTNLTDVSGSVTVQKGDTVYAISRRTGADPRAIIAANNLKPPFVLQPGQTLTLSGGPLYTVKKGDTLYSISRAYGVDVTSLSRVNNLRPPFSLAVGQILAIPGGKEAAPQSTLNVPIPAREGSKFLWPVEGKILSSYGAKDGGLHNDGINIQVNRGDPVKAAESGVVVYAGDGIKGYGNLILIRHAGGWVTAYAHNDKILVKRGDTVKRGDVISWAGITGGVSEPQLHFEIRKGTQAVDPMGYLGG